MKTVIKKSIVGLFLRPYFILTAIALEFLALSPGMRAVTPPPDGGYPGNNTAEGSNALFGLTSGTFNTAIGMSSLQSDTIGSFNTANGAFALVSNTASENTATGAGALYLQHNRFRQHGQWPANALLVCNTTGSGNTATVVLVRFYTNTTGPGNTANGSGALYSNSSGPGQHGHWVSIALYHNTTGTNTTNLWISVAIQKHEA